MLFKALQSTRERLNHSERNAFDIIAWWEIRRIPYNLTVGVWALFCLLLFCIAIDNSGHLEPGEDAVEPLALFVAPVVINGCYTLGWLVELGLHILGVKVSKSFGERLFRAGLIFSLVMVSLPAVIWSVVWLFS